MNVIYQSGWLCLHCGHKHQGGQDTPCPECHIGPSIRAVIREPEEEVKP